MNVNVSSVVVDGDTYSAVCNFEGKGVGGT